MKKVIFTLAIIGVMLSYTTSLAQVGINNPDPDESSILDLKSTDKGLLIPRMSSLDIEAIASPAKGLMVLDTVKNIFFFFDGDNWLTINPWKSVGEGSDTVSLSRRESVVSVGRLSVGGFSSNALVPSGGIIMWSGREGTVPEGWALCNGGTYTYEGRTKRTPDLRGRFIAGYDPSDISYDDPGSLSSGHTFDVGETGGRKRVTLSVSQMPQHKHSPSMIPAGRHSHMMFSPTHANNDNATITGDTPHPVAAVSTTTGGKHSYSLKDISSAVAPTVVSTSEDGFHDHLIDDTPMGGNESHENRPPYYVLAYIMKL